MATPDPRAPEPARYVPGLPDQRHIVGDWDGQVLAAMEEAAKHVAKLESEALAYNLARTLLKSLHARMSADRQRWANNTEDPCAVARAVAYQTDMSAVGRIIQTIETTAGDRP